MLKSLSAMLSRPSPPDTVPEPYLPIEAFSTVIASLPASPSTWAVEPVSVATLIRKSSMLSSPSPPETVAAPRDPIVE